MKLFTNKKTKLALIAGVVALTLTGCGSSSQEEQLTWIANWKHNTEERMKMLNVCAKEAGIRKIFQSTSKQQNEIFNACEISYMTDVAEEDGISLESETIKNNIIQL